MKYCEKCGNQLLDEAVMCPKCGCVVNGKQPTTEQQKRTQKQDKNLMKATFAFLIAIATVAIIIIAAKIQMG